MLVSQVYWWKIVVLDRSDESGSRFICTAENQLIYNYVNSNKYYRPASLEGNYVGTDNDRKDTCDV